MIPELVVISGKGGTGKTSLAAAFIAVADRPAIADCDVDAADLHLVLSPTIRERHEFRSGREAVIRPTDCRGCGTCLDLCRFDAVRIRDQADTQRRMDIDPVACEGCGVCVRFCPAGAIDFPERRSGEWMVSETGWGPHGSRPAGCRRRELGQAGLHRPARGATDRRGDGAPGGDRGRPTGHRLAR